MRLKTTLLRSIKSHFLFGFSTSEADRLYQIKAIKTPIELTNFLTNNQNLVSQQAFGHEFLNTLTRIIKVDQDNMVELQQKMHEMSTQMIPNMDTIDILSLISLCVELDDVECKLYYVAMDCAMSNIRKEKSILKLMKMLSSLSELNKQRKVSHLPYLQLFNDLISQIFKVGGSLKSKHPDLWPQFCISIGGLKKNAPELFEKSDILKEAMKQANQLQFYELTCLNDKINYIYMSTQFFLDSAGNNSLTTFGIRQTIEECLNKKHHDIEQIITLVC